MTRSRSSVLDELKFTDRIAQIVQIFADAFGLRFRPTLSLSLSLRKTRRVTIVHSFISRPVSNGKEDVDSSVL